jgi:hypothetical protein
MIDARIIKLPIRETQMGAVTKYLVFQYVAGKWVLVRPYYKELSKTGRHGYEYYKLLSDDYVVVRIEVSNSGQRSFHINAYGIGQDVLPQLRKLLEMWQKGLELTAEDLIKVLEASTKAK